MAIYINESLLFDHINAAEKIIEIRNNIINMCGIDLTENDTLSSLVFSPIIKKIENSYSPNFARNGGDGRIKINDIFEDVELKTSKVKSLKKGGYSKTSFAFHANGLLYHEKYIFNTWDINTLSPVSVFYITSADSIKIINEELAKLSTAWSLKPKTKGGYDVIRIKEELLLSMIKETKIIDNCKVYIL